MATPKLAPRETIKILMLEDNPTDAELCLLKLKRSGIEVEVDLASSSGEFMEYIRSREYDLVLSDFRLPNWTGLDAFKWLRIAGHDLPFVLVTGTLGDETAIECIKAGVSDYVLKENLERLPVAVRRALSEQKLRQARDQAEEELRESEKLYRLMFQANPNPMWVFDSSTLQFLTVNQAAIHHYGYSLEEFLSMTVKEIRPREDVDRFLRSVDPQVDSGETYSALWKHKKKDGTVIDVEISSQPITFNQNRAQLVLARDVTVQRRIEAQIRESKEQLQLLLDSTAEAIFGIDVDGTCTLCNVACLRVLGYTSESDLLGKNVHTLMHHTRGDGRPYPANECKIFESFQAGKHTHVNDEVFWRANGASVPVEYWSYPIQRDGDIVGSVVTFFDVTERKKTEQQLRQSELRYRSIVDRAPYGIFRVDESGRIAMANPAFAAMLGYDTPQEVVGLNTARDIYCDPTERQRARDYASEDPAVGHETKWKRKDGKIITVRLGGRRLPADDELPGGFEVFVEDVTEQRSLQRKFEHAQKMEAVGRLAGGVAHDFNNLLMVISGYAQLLDELKANNAKVSQYVTQIRQASSRAANITRQLLAFSRKQALETTYLDLNYVVKDLCNMLPRLLGEDIEIFTNLDPHLGTMRADRGQLEQVIMNLAVNARDAMPKGGRLTIETANVSLDIAYHQRREISVPPGRYVLLTVSDTGIGMSAETQRHIFEPFFSTKEEGKGTGLGLATVYGIVKQSQGFIWVYSELGKGSTFKVYLPRLDGAGVTESGSTSPEAASGGTETILLTEDEAALREVSRVYLASKGYTVLEAAAADEALELCRNYPGPIHALVTDLVMPGLGGLELAKAAMELRTGIAVVLVSGYPDRELGRDAASIGAKFLQKPFSLDTLARTLRFQLNKNGRILLIEDSKFMRVAVERSLSAAGFSISHAADGQEGLRVAREMRPDLILLDMLLPGLPGPEILHGLKKDEATRHIPVVVLTVRSEGNKEKLLNEGAAAYLEKSDTLLEDDASSLVNTVLRVLSKRAGPEA